MKEKVFKILQKYFPNFANIERCADEILKTAEFESLCNPDLYEASANEHLENETKEHFMEFAEWISSEVKYQYHPSFKVWTYKKERVTTNDLYSYWLANIK